MFLFSLQKPTPPKPEPKPKKTPKVFALFINTLLYWRSYVTCLHDLVCNLIRIALYSFFLSVVSSLWQKEKEVNDKKEDKKAKAKAEESKEENQSENGETKTNEVYMYIHNSLSYIDMSGHDARNVLFNIFNWGYQSTW